MSLDVKRDLVRLDVCCNDPDNGLFAHRAEQIEIGRELIELEARRRAPTFLELDGSKVRLAGKVWPYVSAKNWIGNWCWNGYWMKIPVAVDFLAWLHSRKLFDVSVGETRISNIWASGRPFDKSDRDLFWRLLGKPSSHEA